VCSGQINNQGMGDQAMFETYDFYLACFLCCTGYHLVDLRTHGRRKVFVFQDRPTRRNDRMAFYGDAAIVRPQAFAATITEAPNAPLSQQVARGQVRNALDCLEGLVGDGLRHGRSRS
jgi:hypothetical protein